MPGIVDTYNLATGIYTRTVDGLVTINRAMTADEIAAETAAEAATSAAVNADALRAKAQQALTANATFQALASPTNAQVLAQVQLLTKECNGLIRLALSLLDSTSGT
jgi:hypothetical protein